MRLLAVVSVVAMLMPALPLTASAYELSITVTHEGAIEPVANAVVTVDSRHGQAPVFAEIYQQNREFHPKVLVIPVGSSVDFPNRDNTQHHVYSFSPAKTFNIELYADRPAAPVVFDTPGIVELGCNIHDHMQGFVVVTDTATVGRTDESGQVTLTLDPDTADRGDQDVTLEIWHPRLPDNTRPVSETVPLGQPAVVTLELSPEPAAEGAMDRLQQRFREL